MNFLLIKFGFLIVFLIENIICKLKISINYLFIVSITRSYLIILYINNAYVKQKRTNFILLWLTRLLTN